MRAWALSLLLLLAPTVTAQEAREFATADGPTTLQLHVADEPLRLTVWAHQGSTHGFVVDGPGSCSERAFPQAVLLTEGSSGGSRASFDCGTLQAGSHNLVLRGGAVTRGSVLLDGGSWEPTPSQNAPDPAMPPDPSLGPSNALWWFALVLLWPLGRLAWLALFSRLPSDRVAGHPRRAAILGLLEAEPGLHTAEVARRTGMPTSSARHHLSLLRMHGHATSQRLDRRTTWRLAATPPTDVVDPRLLRGIPGHILAWSRTPCDVMLLTARAGVAHSTTHRWVQRLERAGLLEVTPGPPRVVCASKKALRALDCTTGPDSL